MAFFETLLAKRGFDRVPHPLWKLKVTDAEYEELRSLLALAAHGRGESIFRALKKECALYFAEYWRREYTEGAHSINAVFQSLFKESVPASVEPNVDTFYKAALYGAKLLHIELYKGEKTQYLDSMFYQGGLPMRLVTLNAKNSVWDRFTRGLVHRRIDFEELQLGKIATSNQSLKDYCNALIDAIDREQYRLMPFYCKDETDPWFRALISLAHQERIRQRQLRPFSLDWEFEVDLRGGTFSSKYIVKGLQRLPEEFLAAQQLLCTSFFSAQVRVNGKAVDTFDYQNRFCRNNVISKHPYHEGDVVSLFLHDKQAPLLSDDLDLSIPHLLYRDKDGKYYLGNKLGTALSLLLVPEGWTVDSEGLTEQTLVWEDKTYNVITVKEGFDGSLTAHGPDGDILFGANAHLYWTEITSSPLYIPDIIESVYNADDIRLALCSDGDALPLIARANEVEFRAKGEASWSSRPSYGEVMARAKGHNGEYVTSVKFLNVGKFSILSSADKESCTLKPIWPHGSVRCEEGVLKSNGAWFVEKSACKDPRKIHFVLTPKGNSRAQFRITVRAPFKDFSILDSDGNLVTGSCVIPYGDLDRYQYHIVGQGIKSYSYGGTHRELIWDGDKLQVYSDRHFLRTIPYEGSLVTLFDSREAVRSLLDKTSKGILQATVPVAIDIDSVNRMVLTIKESPYRVCQLNERDLCILDDGRRPVQYKHALNLFNLSDPSAPRVTLPFSDEFGFVLPDTVLSWEKILVTGRTRGRILPGLIDTTEARGSDEREALRRAAIQRISEEISKAKIADETWKRIIGWFNLSQKEDIPASSLLDLSCLAKNGGALFLFAFQLYLDCKSDEDRDTLIGQLIAMGTDLAFQWYWIRPFSENPMQSLNHVIDWDSPFLKALYVDWAIGQQKDLGEVMTEISDEGLFIQSITICMMSVIGDFSTWLKNLFAASILDIYGAVSDALLNDLAGRIAGKDKNVYIESFDEFFVDLNQDDLDDEGVNAFFAQFDEPGKTRNERWLLQRVNAMAAHLTRKIDLLKEAEEIRRSILFCRKSCPKVFLLELNNKLSH